MSSHNSSASYQQSWIPPSFAWTIAPDIFFIDVPLSDPDVVEFISMGVLQVTVYGTTKAVARVVALLTGKESLEGQLATSVWDPSKLKPAGSRLKAGSEVEAYCHGVFLLPGEKTLCVAVGRAKPIAPYAWISSALQADVDALLLDHQSKLATFEEELERLKVENKERNERYKSDPIYGSWGEAMVPNQTAHQRPQVTVESLLSALPRAARFLHSTSGAPAKLARSAIASIAGSGWPLSRGGDYAGILAGASRRGAAGLVTWVPHKGLPSYPEVRWAVQRRLPAAMRKPRIEQPDRPKFDTVTKSSQESVQIQGFELESTDLKAALDDFEFVRREDRTEVGNVRKNLKEHGFEALAWFQPYHVWTEETWGIYFDASKLDDFALSLLDDFKSQRVRWSPSLAAQLAFGLTYAHELFHARVESALSWQEINVQQPRHLRYQERVYTALRETPDWLEEALANWSAWAWFNSPSTQSFAVPMASNAEGLGRVVAASLDLAPPGYREWRRGHQPETWRTFANQLSTGKPKITTPCGGMPLEGALSGLLPYDFRPADIPVRFVGRGLIADRLLSHPATFNVPPRRELERALRHFNHDLDASGGKGGHQKWTGPDRRAFILPTRDPVSPGVFKTFLHHVGIDKATYVRQVRPNL
jgi:hypothetical protein